MAALTMLEEFTKAAMQGILTNSPGEPKEVSEWAVRYAKATIEALAEDGESNIVESERKNRNYGH